MADFKVRWEINVQAADMVGAAVAAREAMLDETALETSFFVSEDGSEADEEYEVNLLALEEEVGGRTEQSLAGL